MSSADDARARLAWGDGITPPPLTFALVREQNAARAERWHAGADDWTGADWSNAMCGEAGEAANLVKKLRRIETSITQGTYNGDSTPERTVAELVEKLGDELADIVLYVDLLGRHYGVDLARHVRAKFNRVSEAQGFPERL